MGYYHAKVGMVLICDFSGFRAPEMVKRRPVVVVGEEVVGRQGTCLIVPLSTTEPSPVTGFHVQLDPLSLPSRFRSKPNWVKADMITSVACDRLDRIMNGKDNFGKRQYVTHSVTPNDLLRIRRAILVGLHISHLASGLVDEQDF